MFTTRRPLLIKCGPDKTQRKIDLLWLVHKGVVGGLSPDKKIRFGLWATYDNMALKKTSSTIIISGSVTETAPVTFTQATIDLQLNPLDNEVFVIQAVDIDVQAPDSLAAANTSTTATLSQTSRTTIGNLSDSNVFAVGSRNFQGAGLVDGGVSYEKTGGETPAMANLDYIGILATDSFFAQIEGGANVNVKTMNFKVYGYRAKADAATYAALVQSELLSA